MKAARMHEYGKPLVLEDVPVPDIKPDEVLVQVRACGMCRSDVQLIDGYFRKYADIPTPITLGHEITGVVHKLGGLVPRSVIMSLSPPGGATEPAVIARSETHRFAQTYAGPDSVRTGDLPISSPSPL